MDAPPTRPITPYREGLPPEHPPPPVDDAFDERALLWFLVLIGALRVGHVALTRGAWDGETCILGVVSFFAARALFAVERDARGPQ